MELLVAHFTDEETEEEYSMGTLTVCSMACTSNQYAVLFASIFSYPDSYAGPQQHLLLGRWRAGWQEVIKAASLPP